MRHEKTDPKVFVGVIPKDKLINLWECMTTTKTLRSVFSWCASDVQRIRHENKLKEMKVNFLCLSGDIDWGILERLNKLFATGPFSLSSQHSFPGFRKCLTYSAMHLNSDESCESDLMAGPVKYIPDVMKMCIWYVYTRFLSTHNFEFFCSFFVSMDSLQKGLIVYFFLIFRGVPFRSLVCFSVLTGTQQVLIILWFLFILPIWPLNMHSKKLFLYWHGPSASNELLAFAS